ncbi:HD domain-containing protein [Flavobacterium sp.]|uniref:HD domain-containing protein n=1 Tax=Flavobacterium sp. TaxID=239 RepID=UPI003BB9F2D2
MTEKSILDELLKDVITFKANEEEDKILAPLLEEINLISNQQIKLFIRSVLLKAKTFWEIPSSFSGKYHPADEHGPGGNALHTKRVVKISVILSDSYALTVEERDIIYAACLIHDITKGRFSDSAEKDLVYDPMHPYTVGEFVKKCQENDKKYGSDISSSTLFLEEETVQSILRLVRCHLGPWSPVPETIPISYLEMIVHTSDNIASKLHNIIDIKSPS